MGIKFEPILFIAAIKIIVNPGLILTYFASEL